MSTSNLSASIGLTIHTNLSTALIATCNTLYGIHEHIALPSSIEWNPTLDYRVFMEKNQCFQKEQGIFTLVEKDVFLQHDISPAEFYFYSMSHVNVLSG